MKDAEDSEDAAPGDFSLLPERIVGRPDADYAAAIRNRLGPPAVDPRHRSRADPQCAREARLPLPTAKDRPLLGRWRPPLSAAQAADIFAANGLPALAGLCRFLLAASVAEKTVAAFVVGTATMLATVPALLAAIGLSRPPGPVGPFATACAGILVGYYVSIVSFALPHHRVLAPRRFKSPADPQLAGTPAVIAWYWARAITDRAALLRHCPPKDDYAGMEELFVPEEGPKLADAAAVRSSECPCPQCFGLFAGNGWLLVGWFILHHFVVVSGILVAMLCLSFWDLWGSPGSPLLSRPWVAACFAIHVVGIVATNFVAAARENHVMVLAQAQIIRRVQIRASRAACDAFVRECAERVRMSITDRGTSPGFGELVPQPKPATEACNGLKATNEEQLGGPSPDWALPQLYARVASDVKQYGRSRTLYTVYLHLPLGTAGISLLAALLCSFSFGGSCFPAWGFAIPFLGVFVAAGNLADMAVINAASAAVADVYREAGDAVASLAADLPSGPGSAVLAADLERHRMELDRIADALLRGTAKAKFLGFAVTGASLINIAVAVITVGATLFRAFGLRLQLGTYCTPVE